MKDEKTVVNDRLLTIKDVAEKLGYSIGHTKQVVIKMEDFPKPIRITPRGKPQWKESEINEFIESRKEI